MTLSSAPLLIEPPLRHRIWGKPKPSSLMAAPFAWTIHSDVGVNLGTMGIRRCRPTSVRRSLFLQELVNLARSRQRAVSFAGALSLTTSLPPCNRSAAWRGRSQCGPCPHGSGEYKRFGGPNGIRTRVYGPPRARCFTTAIYASLSQRSGSRDLNSLPVQIRAAITCRRASGYPGSRATRVGPGLEWTGPNGSNHGPATTLQGGEADCLPIRNTRLMPLAEAWTELTALYTFIDVFAEPAPERR